MRAIMAAHARAFREEEGGVFPGKCRIQSSHSKELLGAAAKRHRCSKTSDAQDSANTLDAQDLLTMFEARLAEAVGSLEDSLVERMVNFETRLSQLTRGFEESEFSKSKKDDDIQSQLSGLADTISSLQKQTVALVTSCSASPSVELHLREESMPSTPRKSKEVGLRSTSTPQKTRSRLTGPGKSHDLVDVRKHSEDVCRDAEKRNPTVIASDVSQSQTADNDALDARYRFLPERLHSQTSGFTVISLNILAGYLGRNKTHPFCKEEHLAWESRRQKLIDGFKRARPDILLLQEVQGTGKACSDNHVEFLSESLSDVGYKLGTYVRVCGPDGKEEGSKKAKKPHLGNAVYFLKDTWNLLDHGRIAFAQLLAEQCGSNTLQQEHYTEGRQVAAWARLEHVATQRKVVAVSVHVSNKHTQPDKQVVQVNSMLRHLQTKVLQEGDVLVIGGDFNSLPHSGVYQLLSTGALHAEHSDASPSLEAQAAGVVPLCGPEGFCTGLKLASAYTSLNGAEPELTTKAPGFSGTIDYLWYSPGTLAPEMGTGLKMPTNAEAGAEGGGLPNSEIPSDHVPIGLAFAFSNSEHVHE